MLRKYKGLIIALVSVLITIITIVILCFTLFTVQDIKLDYRTELTASYSDEEIIEKSGMKKGSCVFFLKKQIYVDNIEKNFPYLEVINIETEIPSHIVIHLAERREFYAVAYNGQILYCDDEFKVLKIEDGVNYDSTPQNAIFIPENQLKFDNESIETGDFLQITKKGNGIQQLYNSMLVNARTYAHMISTIKEISVYDYKQYDVIVDGKRVEKDYQTSLKLTMHSGREIYLWNIEYGLKYKVQNMYSILSSVMEIQKFKLENDLGEEVVYDKETASDHAEINNILANCEIHLKNYQSEYQFDERTNSFVKVYGEKDCFYELVYNGKSLKKA